MCLQETKCTDQDHLYNVLEKEVGGITYINSKLSKHGVAIIVRKIPLNFKIKEIELNQIIFQKKNMSCTSTSKGNSQYNQCICSIWR